MATLKVYNYWECDLNGVKYSDGSRAAPVEVTVTKRLGGDITLADATTLDLWSSADSLTDFDYFWLISDVDIRIELTVDRGAEVGLEEIALLIESNTPFQLFYDDALALYTSNFAAGTADVIDMIRLRNVSGGTATISWALFT